MRLSDDLSLGADVRESRETRRGRQWATPIHVIVISTDPHAQFVYQFGNGKGKGIKIRYSCQSHYNSLLH